MALFKVLGNSGASNVAVDALERAAVVTKRPVEYGTRGMYAVSSTSGIIPATLTTGSDIFQFRYMTGTEKRFALLHFVSISAAPSIEASAAGFCGFSITKALAWTTVGSGGNRLTLTGDNAKLKTSMATSEVNDAGISNTLALTIGTRTLESQPFGSVRSGIGTGTMSTQCGTSLLQTKTDLFNSYQHGSSPLMIRNQEGFVVRTTATMPTLMNWSFSVDVAWSELEYF